MSSGSTCQQNISRIVEFSDQLIPGKRHTTTGNSRLPHLVAQFRLEQRHNCSPPNRSQPPQSGSLTAMHRYHFWLSLPYFALITAFTLTSRAEDSLPQKAEASTKEFGSESIGNRQRLPIRIVDESGNFVPDTRVGFGAGHQRWTGPAWTYVGVLNEKEKKWEAGVTDETGITHVDLPSNSRPVRNLVARHVERNLVAVSPFKHEQMLAAVESREPITATLVPACRVFGKLTSTRLAKTDSPIGFTSASVKANSTWAVTSVSREQQFEFFLPPGTYELKVNGNHVYKQTSKFDVEQGAKELELPEIDLQPTPMPLLIGKPAPEFAEVNEWMNSKPLKLADLKGKHVLLVFWGHWCGPCLVSMPDVIALHEKYQHQLVVIGVHVGSRNPDEEINTIEALQEQLLPVVEGRWEGRQITFPNALVNAREVTNLGEAGQERSKFAQLYGVTSYPSEILIDPEGLVVGEVDHEEIIKKLEARKQIP